jgi:ABC-type nitrate/sulfonate/bicarbonate transport system substrate-binding protein
VANHRAALVDFLEDNIRMRAWMTNPQTRPDALRQIADTAKQPASDFAEWVYTKKDYYYHPQAMVDPQRLQRNIDTMKEAGMTKDTIDVRRYVDMSLATEAAARVK